MLKILLLIAFTVLSRPAAGAVSAVWANSGEDKITRDELRAAQGRAGKNTVWDGSAIHVFGARNEVVAFNVILEAATQPAHQVTVSFRTLKGSSDTIITSDKTSGTGVFNWTQRPIELFYVRYLQIKGLSQVSYDKYDERHVPQRLRRPMRVAGRAAGGWNDRPDRDKFYPDIAVPLEWVPSFSIAAGQNQSIWIDIYIPKTAF